jgi:hypothetical protein
VFLAEVKNVGIFFFMCGMPKNEKKKHELKQAGVSCKNYPGIIG